MSGRAEGTARQLQGGRGNRFGEDGGNRTTAPLRGGSRGRAGGVAGKEGSVETAVLHVGHVFLPRCAHGAASAVKKRQLDSWGAL